MSSRLVGGNDRFRLIEHNERFIYQTWAGDETFSHWVDFDDSLTFGLVVGYESADSLLDKTKALASRLAKSEEGWWEVRISGRMEYKIFVRNGRSMGQCYAIPHSARAYVKSAMPSGEACWVPFEQRFDHIWLAARLEGRVSYAWHGNKQ